MKKLLSISAAVMALAAAPAYASCTNPGNNCGGGNSGGGGLSETGLSGNLGGSLSGSTHTIAITGGGSLGNGSTMSEAGQFAGATAKLTGGMKDLSGTNQFTEGGSLEATILSESYVQGFDKAESWGDAISGSLRGGLAEASGSYWGDGSGNW